MPNVVKHFALMGNPKGFFAKSNTSGFLITKQVLIVTEN
jgi:hypothetical protein